VRLANDNLKSDLLLLSTAIIWGVAFVAQRVGMVYVGPFTFNGIRFALGILILLPFAIKGNHSNATRLDNFFNNSSKIIRWGGFLAGIVIFMAVSLQQVGLVSTTAGKAGFITGLYVVIVPMIGLFLGQINQQSLVLWLQYRTSGLITQDLIVPLEAV
jgi:drug/metabolite transporter (DMT)-like permease